MYGKLYGVGVGPGDPELLTLKAVTVLQQVDYICVPQSRVDGESLALQIIKEKIDCHGRIKKLIFPMSYQEDKLKQARKKAADQLTELLQKGKELAFITIGDPLLYSTYNYIIQRLQKLANNFSIETVPGITSITACAASCNLPLALEGENIAVLADLTDDKRLEQIFDSFRNIVIVKLSKNFKKVYPVLERLGLKEKAVVISRCGQKEEKIIKDISQLSVAQVDYLSLLITKQGEETMK